MAGIDNDVRQLADEFRRLREVRGHWDGEAWNADVDAFNGAKHVTMKRIGEAVGSNAGLTARELHDLLGSPDRILESANELQMSREAIAALNTQPGDRLHVYHWRNGHDFLYFRVNNDRVTGSDWYHAGE